MDRKTINFKANMRGIKKCSFCGHYNGFRAKSCKNKLCFSFVNEISKKNFWMDPIELISNSKTRIFSVRVKERETIVRNFVEITDTTLSTEDDYTSIVNRNAICYADTCKYDVGELEIICKHVKSATICNKKAEKLEIDKTVIDGLNITQYYKDAIWNMYNKNLVCVPPLQRLNAYTFAVQCPRSTLFPAGRLHIFVAPVGINLKKFKLQYLCACRKLKGISETGYTKHSTDENFCFHILFLLTAIMSSSSLKYEFRSFCSLFQSFWDTCELNKFQNNEDNASDRTLQQSDDNNNQRISSLMKFDNKNKSPPYLSNTIQVIESPVEGTKLLELTDVTKNKADKTVTLTNNYIDFKLMDDSNLIYNEFENINIFETPTDINFGSQNSSNIFEIASKTCNENQGNNEIFEEQDKSEFGTILQSSQLNIKEKNQLTDSLYFTNWLSYVIEKINKSIQFTEQTKIVHEFNILENFFTLLHNRFSSNNRKRLPNSFNSIKFQNRDLIKYSWLFSNKSLLKEIFKTETSVIQFERIYGDVTKILANGLNENCDSKMLGQYKIIKPKTNIVFIRLETDPNSGEKSDFVIEWIPNVYPWSKFGVLKIEFSVDFKIS